LRWRCIWIVALINRTPNRWDLMKHSIIAANMIESEVYKTYEMISRRLAITNQTRNVLVMIDSIIMEQTDLALASLTLILGLARSSLRR
jgi:hypothetical protein